MTDIFLPGVGMVPIEAVSASNAVSDYDSDLMLGRMEATGDWHVFVKKGPHGGQPFPVFYIGPELPSYDRLQQMLYEHDVRRHGVKLIHAIERRKAAERDRLDKEAHDLHGEIAEHIEWAHRQMGTHPNPRIFVPSEKG